MSTKTTTSQSSNNSLQYDPQSLARYQQLTGASANVLTQYMKNPLNNPYFRMGASQAQQGAIKLGQQNMNAFNQNYLTSGFGGSAGAAFKASQMNQIGRSNQALRSQAQIGNIMQAYQRQLGAAGMGMSFNPLMTGTSSSGNSTETKSGLGTWLPQLLGAGLGAAAGFIPHGGGGGGGGMGYQGAGSGGWLANQSLSNFNTNMGMMNQGINWNSLAQGPSGPSPSPFQFSY